MAWPETEEDETSSQLHPHGDGTFHTTSAFKAGRVDHPSFGHAVMHLAKLHSEGPQMHLSREGNKMVAHELRESGHTGATVHTSLSALKRHVTQVMGDE